jgi:hypothetical protein
LALEGESERGLVRNMEGRIDNLYFSSHVVWMISSRMIGCVGHVLRLGEVRNSYTIAVGEPEEKRLIRKLLIKQQDMRVWARSIWLRI